LTLTIPQEISSEHLRALVIHLPHSRNTIIEGQMAVAYKIAVWYSRRYRRDKEELVAVANLALVQCVDRAANGSLHDDNIGAYIAVNLHGACRKHIDGDHLIPVERRAVKDYYAKYGKPGVVDLREESAEHAVDTAMIWGELMDLFTKEQQTIIHMRINGYNQSEIGKELHCTQATISKSLDVIRERLMRIGILTDWLRNQLKDES